MGGYPGPAAGRRGHSATVQDRRGGRAILSCWRIASSRHFGDSALRDEVAAGDHFEFRVKLPLQQPSLDVEMRARGQRRAKLRPSAGERDSSDHEQEDRDQVGKQCAAGHRHHNRRGCWRVALGGDVDGV